MESNAAPKPPGQSIGENIRKARTRAGLTQKDLAEALSVSVPMISRLERGRRELTATELARLHAAYGWNPQGLLGVSRQAASRDLSNNIAGVLRRRPSEGLRRAALVIEIDAILDGLGVPGGPTGFSHRSRASAARFEHTAVAAGENDARTALASCGISTPDDKPLGDALLLAETLGIEVMEAPLGQRCGSVRLQGPTTALCVINQNVSPENQTWHLARAVGHLLAHTGWAVTADDWAENVLEEKRADAFAHALLGTAREGLESRSAAPLPALPARFTTRLETAYQQGLIGPTLVAAVMPPAGT